MVKEGQVLFLMDAKPFQVQVDAQAAALARQQAALEVARADLERTKPLAAQNALSQKDLDDATGQYLATAAAVEEAKARLETAKLNLSYCTIVSPVTGHHGRRPAAGRDLHQPPEQPPDHGGGALAHLGELQPLRERDAGLPRAGRERPAAPAQGRQLRRRGPPRRRLALPAHRPDHLRRRRRSTPRRGRS